MLNLRPVTQNDDATVAEALSAIGMHDRIDASVMVMSMTRNVVKHHWLSSRDLPPLAGAESLYVASGLFTPGVLSRKRENLERIVWLPFDADLITHQNVRDDERDDFRDQSQDEIDAMIAIQLKDLVDTFGRMGVQLHRIDYTGYGLAGYLYIDETDQTRIDDLRAMHVAIVERANTLAGFDLIDTACTDAGTRVTRIPGSYNNKATWPRLVRTLHYDPGATIALGTPRSGKRHAAMHVPASGTGLPAAAVDDLVAALAPFWTDGQRHAMSVATAGMLGKHLVPETQAEQIMATLAAGDKRPTDRMRAVATSYDRLRRGDTVQGWTALRDMVSGAALRTVSTVLERHRDAVTAKTRSGKVTLTAATLASRGGEAAESLADDEWAKMFPPVPDICYYGSFETYRSIMAPTTEAPDVYHLASALTWFGALIGRTISGWYASNRLYPNLYTVLIGASGRTRKNTAIERAIELPKRYPQGTGLREPDIHYYINRDIASAEGFVKDLSEMPRQILYLDEFSIIQKNAARKGTRTIFDKLIQAYDNPPFLSNRSIANPYNAKEPSVAMIAATQPRRLSDQMTSEDIHSGFANRLIYVIGASKGRMARPPDVDEEAAWRIYLAWDDVIRSYGTSGKAVLRMDPSAHDRWDEWYARLESVRDRTEDENDMVVRLPVHIQKLALIYAISDGDDRVYDRHLEPAIAFVDWMWEVVKELIKGWGIGIDQQIELAIERALQRHGPMTQRTLRDRTRNRRRWSDRDFAMVVRSMKDNGTIEEGTSGLIWFAADAQTGGDQS